MTIITNYPDDSVTTDSDKFLTSDSSGSTKLTAASTVKDYVLADGNITTEMLGDGSVTGGKIAAGAITLGYAEITSNFQTTSAGWTDVAGLSTTFTVPDGGRKVKTTVFCGFVTATGQSGLLQNGIYDSSNNQLSIAGAQNAVAGHRYSMTPMRIQSLAAGVYTYKARVYQEFSGTLTFLASPVVPAFILIELV